MESQRLILFFVFSFSVFLLLDAWQKDQRPPVQPAAVTSTPAPSAAKGDTAAVPTPSPAALPAPQGRAAVAPEGVPASVGGEVVRIETDLLRAEISSVGGDLRRLEFKQHRGTLDKSKPFVLFQSGEHTYLAQAGLIGPSLPNHRTAYTVRPGARELADGADVLELRLDAPAAGDVKVSKIYRFRRGSYLVDVAFEIANQGSTAVQPHGYFQLVRDARPPDGDSAMLPTFTGAAVYTDKEKFQKLTFSDIDKNKMPYPKTSTDGWVSILQHYFVAAWLPAGNVSREFYTKRLDGGLYSAGVILQTAAVEPGSTVSLAVPLYAGPQDQEKLAKLAPGLDLVVDYGWLTVIAVPLFWFLKWIHQWVSNWGVAIIILTVIIKLLFYPLAEASYRSMAKMRILAPKMQKLKEQYGDDRQRMQQAMMELYKTEKINPLGGCLPILVQIPVFIALYWVLLASVELRHAPFMLWIDDLSNADPWYVLPVLMGATMIIQTKLNPEPPDPVQAKVMKIMPIAFSVFFFFFPAGLVLYWLVNNVLSIAQQWHINRVLERANLAQKAKA